VVVNLHGDGGKSHATHHGLGLEERGTGDELQLDNGSVGTIRKVWEVLGSGALLEQRLCLDLGELKLDQLVVWGETAQGSESLAALCLTAVVDKPSRGEGHFGRLATSIDGQMSEAQHLLNVIPPSKIRAGRSCRQRGTSQAASFWVAPVPPM